LDYSVIQVETEWADAYNVMLEGGRLFHLYNSEVTTLVAGGTGSGGNILLNAPNFLVLNNSRIQANALVGAGGNITIQIGQLIGTPNSAIQASSEFALSGITFFIVLGDLRGLPEMDAGSELRVACAARGGRPASSFNAGGRGGLPPDPGAPLTASLTGQPLEQQTAAGSPTTSTARPRQAGKPTTVAGIPQPVLGSPRLTCRR
jgi:large exoprotein involved in heme utilization and adhesion